MYISSIIYIDTTLYRYGYYTSTTAVEVRV